MRRGSDGTFSVDNPSANAEIPFDASEPLPIVSVKLNGGRIAHFMIDTGAPGVVVDPRVVTELGLKTEDAGRGEFPEGMAIKHASIAQLELGTVSMHNIPVLVMPMDGAPAPSGMKIDGILGTSLFYRFLTTLDYGKAHLVLRARGTSAQFERDAASRSASIVRMWYVPDHFVFARAKVNGKTEGLFNIDTGGEGIGIQATKSTIDAASIKIDTKHPGQFDTPGGPVKTFPFSASVALGTHYAVSAPGVYFPAGDQYKIFPFRVAGTLSDRLFQHTALTFDFVAMRLVIEKS